jgi:hypothetical protein
MIYDTPPSYIYTEPDWFLDLEDWTCPYTSLCNSTVDYINPEDDSDEPLVIEG